MAFLCQVAPQGSQRGVGQGTELWKASMLLQTCDIETSLSADALTVERDISNKHKTRHGYIKNVFSLLFLRMTFRTGEVVRTP